MRASYRLGCARMSGRGSVHQQQVHERDTTACSRHNSVKVLDNEPSLDMLRVNI
jgi:hypothetical protein